MKTENHFSLDAFSSYQCLLLRDPLGGLGLFERVHRAPPLPTWKPLKFAFRVAGKRGVALSDICTIYARGVLKMRGDVKAQPRPSCSQLFARPPFKQPVERLLLKGVEFQRVRSRLIAQSA